MEAGRKEVEHLSISKAKKIAHRWKNRQTGLPFGCFVMSRAYLPDKCGRLMRIMIGNFLVMEIIVHDNKKIEILRDRRDHHRVLDIVHEQRQYKSQL